MDETEDNEQRILDEKLECSSYSSGLSSEDSVYFDNEERVFKNHMRLNVLLQVFCITLMLVAALLTDWAHV
jgi:hypothetical protein